MRPRASSTTTCAGAQPERPPTEPEASSASRKACEMNGLNRSPPASSVERPGGLAQASHAAASRAAIDEATRAVKVVEAMAECGPDSAAPHHSMGFRATAKADEGRGAQRRQSFSRAAQLRKHERERAYAPVLGVAAVLHSHNVDDFDGDRPAGRRDAEKLAFVGSAQRFSRRHLVALGDLIVDL